MPRAGLEPIIMVFEWRKTRRALNHGTLGSAIYNFNGDTFQVDILHEIRH